MRCSTCVNEIPDHDLHSFHEDSCPVAAKLGLGEAVTEEEWEQCHCDPIAVHCRHCCVVCHPKILGWQQEMDSVGKWAWVKRAWSSRFGGEMLWVVSLDTPTVVTGMVEASHYKVFTMLAEDESAGKQLAQRQIRIMELIGVDL